MDQISASVWHGHVTVQVAYGSHVYLLQARRNAYFPLYFSQIAVFFDALTGSHLQNKHLWLQNKDTPLHWNIPVGVLYDMFCGADRSFWAISLHAPIAETAYPAQILPLNSADSEQKSVQHMFMNSIKMANYVICGNSRAVMRLSTGETRVLWQAAVSNDYSQMQEVYGQIDEKYEESYKKFDNRVPVKVYVDRQMVQAPCAAQTTLRQCLAPLVNLNETHVYIHGINAAQMYDVAVGEVWRRFRHLDMVMYVVACSMPAC